MPFKKKEVKTEAAKTVVSKSNDDYKKELASQKSQITALKKELTALKKDIASLKGQCQTCCDDLAQIKNTENKEVLDNRVDQLIRRILSSHDYKTLRRLYK